MAKPLMVIKCEYRKCGLEFTQTWPTQRFCCTKHAEKEKTLKRKDDGYGTRFMAYYKKEPANFLRTKYYNYRNNNLLKYSATPEEFIACHISRPDFIQVHADWIANPIKENLPVIVRLWDGGVADEPSAIWNKRSLYTEPRKNFTGHTIKGRYIIKPVLETMQFSQSVDRIWTVECLNCNRIYDMCEAGFSSSVNTAERCRYCAYKDMRSAKSANYKGYKDLRGSYLCKMRLLSERRGRPFTVDVKFLWELLEKQGGKCALSGVPIHFSPDYQKGHQTASLDRIDSNGGYTPDNVQWVHKKLNVMKSDLTQTQFIEYCTLVARKAESTCVTAS